MRELKLSTEFTIYRVEPRLHTVPGPIRHHLPLNHQLQHHKGNGQVRDGGEVEDDALVGDDREVEDDALDN